DTELQPSPIVDLIERALAIALSDLDLRSNVQAGKLVIDHDWDDCHGLSLPVANTEIEQVLFNIIKNAWQAILARQEPDFVGHIHIRCQRQRQHCVIQVSDNGRGMDIKTKKRVFEPFFTTKEVGEGTGLGLSVAYFIITSHHHGQLSVKSEPETGTTFTLKLPLAQVT
ncbi:MAG: ATP-binding protein, partial [Natronospirillum sp.]